MTMKIVSLQSVGLADVDEQSDKSVYFPTIYIVGQSADVHGSGSVVLSIEFYEKHPEFYYIQLKNKHQLVVPVDYYIAEYAPDEEKK